jgi:hypothetical protein
MKIPKWVLKKAGLDMNDPVVRSVFLREGLEPVTDALIDEISQGSPKAVEDLRYFQAAGMEYCRSRGSFVGPIEIDGNPEFMKLFGR